MFNNTVKLKCDSSDCYNSGLIKLFGARNEVKEAAKNKMDIENLTDELYEMLEEQSEYYWEIVDFQEDLERLQEEFKNDQDTLTQRWLVLNEKSVTGEITEEEQKELENLNIELNNLNSNYQADTNNINNNISSTVGAYNVNGSDLISEAKNLNSVSSNTISSIQKWNDENADSNAKLTNVLKEAHTEVINDLSSSANNMMDKVNIFESRQKVLK